MVDINDYQRLIFSSKNKEYYTIQYIYLYVKTYQSHIHKQVKKTSTRDSHLGNGKEILQQTDIASVIYLTCNFLLVMTLTVKS